MTYTREEVVQELQNIHPTEIIRGNINYHATLLRTLGGSIEPLAEALYQAFETIEYAPDLLEHGVDIDLK